MYANIKRLANAQGMTIADVCRAAGISESALSMLKKRGGSLSLDSAVKVARVLGVPVEALMETAVAEPVNMEVR